MERLCQSRQTVVKERKCRVGGWRRREKATAKMQLLALGRGQPETSLFSARTSQTGIPGSLMFGDAKKTRLHSQGNLGHAVYPCLTITRLKTITI